MEIFILTDRTDRPHHGSTQVRTKRGLHPGQVLRQVNGRRLKIVVVDPYVESGKDKCLSALRVTKMGLSRELFVLPYISVSLSPDEEGNWEQDQFLERTGDGNKAEEIEAIEDLWEIPFFP